MAKRIFDEKLRKSCKENASIMKLLRKNWLVVAVIVLCIIKQLITVSLPVYARDAGGPDQYKLLIDAESIYGGGI